MSIVITVKVSLDVAHALHEQNPIGEAKELLELVMSLGLKLETMHPDARDPLLIPFFTIEAPDQATADRAITKLNESIAVEGAYIKPPEALP